KAYGMARARRLAGRTGRIVLMTGDGELQEGQIWESLQPVANERLSEIIAVVDHNKLQSDSAVSAVSDLGRIEDKFRAFGWDVRRVDGHDFRAIHDAFSHFATVADRPKVLIADTIKGKGVSFMEGLAGGDETYHFHAGAPSLKDYLAAVAELTSRTNERHRDHLQQRDRAQEGHLSRDARGSLARRSRSLASVAPRHLRNWIGPGPDGDRTVQRARGAAGDPLGGGREPGEYVSSLRQRAARSTVRIAVVLHDADRPRRHAARGYGRGARRLRTAD